MSQPKPVVEKGEKLQVIAIKNGIAWLRRMDGSVVKMSEEDVKRLFLKLNPD